MNNPGTFVVDPISIGVESGGLIDEFFVGFFDSSDGNERRGAGTTVRWSFDREKDMHCKLVGVKTNKSSPAFRQLTDMLRRWSFSICREMAKLASAVAAHAPCLVRRCALVGAER